MDKNAAVDLIRNSLMMTIMIAAPALLLSVAIGLVISILQTVTQIQEQTLTFVPKILALLACAMLFGPWMIDSVADYIYALWSNMHEVAPH